MSSVLNLNNEVVKMRKDVKKVKVLTIRRLTRNISKLKSKKGTEELIQKNQRRAQRLLEEIHTIKKLRPDDVTKTALLKEINFEKVCKKPSTTLEFRAIARLATHPLLKQKITTIKDAIKAFKEARKNGAEQEDKMDETCKPVGSAQIVKKNTEKQSKQKDTTQKQKAEDTNPGDESMDNLPCIPLHKETDLVSSNKGYDENTVDSQNGQKPASLSKAKMSAKRKTVGGVPKKPASLMVPKESTEKKLVEGVLENPASLIVPKVSAEKKIVADVLENPASLIVPKVSAEKKIVDGVPEKLLSLTAPEVSAERKQVVGTPEKQVLEDKIESESGLATKTPVQQSGSDFSDIEDSDKEDKEYFDDSTEERFHKQSSWFEDSDSDSEDDFFLGKVRQTKKKKSSKNPSEDRAEKEKLPTESTKSSAGVMEGQKGNAAPKNVKLESVFCSSLSNTKQRSSFMKRETKLPPIRNKKEVVPQAPKLVKKPPAARNSYSAVKSQSKPEPALHPSWEASKKRKEQSQIAVFQGKKIVFDD